MTRDEIRAALDSLGVKYPKGGKGSGRADLLALLQSSQALLLPSSAVVSLASELLGKPPAPKAAPKAWMPAWIRNATRVPPNTTKALICRASKPKGCPPGGGSWIHAEVPTWLR